MSHCQEIRDLFPLAAAGALDPNAEERLAEHIRACPACSAELDAFQLLARGLRRLPTPQPSRLLVERARAAAELRMAEEAAQRSDRNILILLTGFAWTLIIVSWPVLKLLRGGVEGWVSARVPQTLFAFLGFTGLGWLSAGAAAIVLALHHRREKETT